MDRDDDFGNRLAVSLAQDAVELLLRIVVRERGLAIEPRAGLDKLISAVDRAAEHNVEKRMPHVARIEDLNKSRVAFKHAGIAPARPDAVRLVRFGLEFLEAACPRFLGIEYSAVSLAHQIRDEQLRELLRQAETLLKAGKYTDAVVEAAEAVRAGERQLGELLPPVSRANVTGDNDPALINYLNGLRLMSLAGLVGYNPRALMRFRGLAPVVQRSMSGERSVMFNGPPNYTLQHATFAVAFALDFSLAVQKKLG